MPVDYKCFVHPDDEKAMNLFRGHKFFELLTSTYIEHVHEDVLHGINLVSKIRLSPKQIPRLYSYLPPICDKLQIKEPEFYMEMNPYPNAYTYGDKNPAIVITSGLTELLPEDELKAAIAHECGHILCEHVRYRTMAQTILQGGMFLLDKLAMPAVYALNTWCRNSEFSADRVACWVVDDNPNIVTRMMMRLSGGGRNITEGFNVDEYYKQISAYDEFVNTSHINKWVQNLLIADALHPYPGIRSREILAWYNSPDRGVPGVIREQDDEDEIIYYQGGKND